MSIRVAFGTSIIIVAVTVATWQLTKATSAVGRPSIEVPVEDVPRRFVEDTAPAPLLAASVIPEAQTRTLGDPRYMGGPDDFGHIQSLADVGGYLVVADDFLSPHIAVLDLATGQVLYRFGRDGEGPGEFRQPGAIRRAGPDSLAVWIHDFSNRRVSLATVSAHSAHIDTELRLAVATSAENPVRLEDGWIAAGLYGAAAVLLFFDHDGRPTSRFGRPPYTMRDVGHPVGVRLVNRSTMVPHPDLTRFAVGFFSANRLDVYDRGGRLMWSGRGPRDVEVKYHVADDRFFWDRGNELAYTSITANSDFVFALFCGCALGEGGVVGREVFHAWSWDGNFVGEYRLSGLHVSRIAMSEDGRHLFGVVDEPFPSVAMWELPPELLPHERR